MSLADDLLQPPDPGAHRGAVCSVKVLCDQLTEDGDLDAAKAVLALVADQRTWSGPAIQRRLKSLGLHLTSAAVQRHRRGECRCL